MATPSFPARISLAAVGAAALAVVLLAGPALAAILPPSNPSSNVAFDPSGSSCTATASSGPDSSAACVGFDLAMIDAARADEGVGPMYLPSDYAQLSGAEQQFVVINLERTDRGVPALTGLSDAMDSLAAEGATGATDPPFAAAGWQWVGSIWAAGFVSTLEADFVWMYDDGTNSPNVDCPSAGASGCWVHRDIILANPAGAAMIAGTADSYVNGALQYAAELEQPVGAQPALSYTWAAALAAGADQAPRPPGWPVPVRLAGADRVATAISVSQSSFASVGASGTHAGAVIIAVDNTYPDALAAVPLAAAAQAPILITNGTTLDPRVSAEIARVLPLGGEVYLIGGVQALAPAVAQAVESAGYVVTRLAGPDRFGTAVAVADALGDPTTVFEADGDNFADALAAGPAAAADHGVVLLTDGTNLPLATATYLAEHAPTRYAIGGPAAQADPGAIAIVGADRYATAAAVAVTFFSNPAVIGFATGVTYPDALAAGAQLGAGDSPLLLVGTNSVPASTAAYLAADSSALPMVYGGSAALSALVTQAL